MKGYVYVLTNESMPGIVKVGRSIHGGKKRARDLYSGTTGVPSPFILDFEMMFDDCVEAERAAVKRVRIKRAARLKAVSRERYQNYIEAFPEAAAIEIVK